MLRKAIPIFVILLLVALMVQASALRELSSSEPAPQPARGIPADFRVRPGTYKLDWNSDVEYWSALIQKFRIDDAVKARITKLPNLASENAEYAAFQIDGNGSDGLIVVIMDESGGTDKGFDTVFVDANRNWDLSDDAPLSLKKESPEINDYHRLSDLGWFSSCWISDWVKVSSHQGRSASRCERNPIEIRFKIMQTVDMQTDWFSYADGRQLISLEAEADSTAREVLISKKGAWRGRIRGESGEADITLLDADNNGVYGEGGLIQSFPITQAGEMMLGQLNGAVIINQSGQRLIRIGEKLFFVSANSIGNQVRIQHYTGPTGVLVVQAPDMAKLGAYVKSIEFQSDRMPAMSLGCGSIELPVGKYKVNSCNLGISNGEFKDWEVNCSFEDQPPVAVDAGSKTVLDMKGKMNIVIEPDSHEVIFVPGDYWKLELVTKIGTGAIFTNVNGMDSPQVEILDEAGKSLFTTTAGRT